MVLANPLREILVPPLPEPVAGVIAVPQRPGLGFELNEARVRVTRASGRVDWIAPERGRVYDRDKGDTHGAKNVGPTRDHEVLVELKG